MLNRQRALLAILGEFKEAIAPITLVKLAFLASIESDLQSDRTFYEFVPYHYGPFSFALYRELSTLRDYGYVTANHSSVALNDRLRVEAFREMRAMPAPALASVRKIVARYDRRPGTPSWRMCTRVTPMVRVPQPPRRSAHQTTGGGAGDLHRRLWQHLDRRIPRTAVPCGYRTHHRRASEPRFTEVRIRETNASARSGEARYCL